MFDAPYMNLPTCNLPRSFPIILHASNLKIVCLQKRVCVLYPPDRLFPPTYGIPLLCNHRYLHTPRNSHISPQKLEPLTSFRFPCFLYRVTRTFALSHHFFASNLPPARQSGSSHLYTVPKDCYEIGSTFDRQHGPDKISLSSPHYSSS